VTTLTGAEDHFEAEHLDPFTRQNQHGHRWTVRAWWDTTAHPRDVRVLRTKLERSLDGFRGQLLDSFLSPATNETIAAAILQLVDADLVEVSRDADREMARVRVER
jgi:hypothetical protein